MTYEIRVTNDSPTGANFHVYIDGAYHCSCVDRGEAVAVIGQRFPGAVEMPIWWCASRC